MNAKPVFEIRKVWQGREQGTASLWLVVQGERAFAQIEKFRDDRHTKNPYKVFSCNSAGVRNSNRPMVVFYAEDGGWDAAVKHALTYA